MNYKEVDRIAAVVPLQPLRSESVIDKSEKDMKGRPFNYLGPSLVSSLTQLKGSRLTFPRAAL